MRRRSDADASAVAEAVRAALTDLCVEVDLGPDEATMVPAGPVVVDVDVEALAAAVVAGLVDARRAPRAHEVADVIAPLVPTAAQVAEHVLPLLEAVVPAPVVVDVDEDALASAVVAGLVDARRVPRAHEVAEMIAPLVPTAAEVADLVADRVVPFLADPAHDGRPGRTALHAHRTHVAQLRPARRRGRRAPTLGRACAGAGFFACGSAASGGRLAGLAHHVEVDGAVDALDVREAVDLPDVPPLDVRAAQEPEVPQRPVEPVTNCVPAFPVVTHVEDELAVPRRLDLLDERVALVGHGVRVGPVPAVAGQLEVDGRREPVVGGWSPRAVLAVDVGIHVAFGVGVFLGRAWRFNSWDLANRPGEVLKVIAGGLLDPQPRTVTIVLLASATFAVGTMLVHVRVLAVAGRRVLT